MAFALFQLTCGSGSATPLYHFNLATLKFLWYMFPQTVCDCGRAVAMAAAASSPRRDRYQRPVSAPTIADHENDLKSHPHLI